MSDITAMGDAGKAMPVPRGQYSDTETYDYLDFVYSGDASYIAKKLTTGNPPAENNEYWQLFARGGTLTENSDVSDTTVTFEQAENRANIFSKDSLKTIMGKISRMYSDLKAVAFSGKYTDLEGRVTLTNNLLATIAGTALDAVQGKILNDKITQLNSDLLKNSKRNLAFLGLSNSGITSYPTEVGLYRITTGASSLGLPANYGVLLVTGCGFYLHLYVSSEERMWLGHTSDIIQLPPVWKEVVTK